LVCIFPFSPITVTTLTMNPDVVSLAHCISYNNIALVRKLIIPVW